jgi:hypothetical protein
VREVDVDIADWLRRLGLHQYESVFRDNDVDTETLPSLTAEDLRELGITSLGHRKKLLAAIAALSPTLGRLEDDRGPPLAEASPSRPSIKNRPAERRHLTVMFVDLVGSTALADPEPRFVADTLTQRKDNARLADAGLAGQHDDLTFAAIPARRIIWIARSGPCSCSSNGRQGICVKMHPR